MLEADVLLNLLFYDPTSAFMYTNYSAGIQLSSIRSFKEGPVASGKEKKNSAYHFTEEGSGNMDPVHKTLNLHLHVGGTKIGMLIEEACMLH